MLNFDRLEAFTVNNWRSRFVVFGLAYPHLLEGSERSQDWASDPDWIFTLWWCNNLDFHRVWSQLNQLFLHSICNALIQSTTALNRESLITWPTKNQNKFFKYSTSLKVQCWRIGPFLYQCHISWCCQMWSRGFPLLPFPKMKAETRPPDI